jgi:phasin family protein
MTDDVTTGSGSEQFTKILESFRVPGLDVKAIMDSQRKNMEALAQATRVAAQGATDVSQKQAEILRTAVQEAMSMAGSLKGADAMATAKAQQEFIKKAFETAVANARELAEMVTQSNRDAYQVIERRTKESLEELRAAAQSKGAGGPT